MAAQRNSNANAPLFSQSLLRDALALRGEGNLLSCSLFLVCAVPRGAAARCCFHRASLLSPDAGSQSSTFPTFFFFSFNATTEEEKQLRCRTLRTRSWWSRGRRRRRRRRRGKGCSLLSCLIKVCSLPSMALCLSAGASVPPPHC